MPSGSQLKAPALPHLMLMLLHVLLAVVSAQNEVVVTSGDLAVSRVFTSTSTCGTAGPEEYCRLVNPSNSSEECFTCDASNPANAHGAEFLSDMDSSSLSSRTWWQSSNAVEKVNLTLDLGSLFFFTHLIVTFRSPRPAALVIERSRDFGQTYTPYQYYSENCMRDFGLPDRSSIRSVEEVICTSEYSSIQPFTNAELIYRAIPPYLGVTDYNTQQVTNKITLTNLRIRFLRLNTLPGDNLSDPLTAKRYRYAVYSVVVRGWCFCNGHALECDPPDTLLNPLPGMVSSQCRCIHGTQGENCGQCLPLFNDRPWQSANGPNEISDPSRYCRECQCYGHASSCHYDPVVAMETPGSGGVCDNCTHNTTGRYCHQCLVGFYRNTSTLLSDTDVCLPCDCEIAGSKNGGVCHHDDDSRDLSVISGGCVCRPNVMGERCDVCKEGYFNLSDSNPDGCQACQCDPVGSESSVCSVETGRCKCKENVTGRKCDQCKPKHCCLSSTGCSSCNCTFGASISLDCHPDTGRCSCRDGVTGEKCGSLAADRFIFTHLPLDEAVKLPLGGEFALWVQIDPDDFRNVSAVNYTLLFTSSAFPPPDPSLCSPSDSQVTTGSIPFQDAVLVQDAVSGQYYLQLVPAFCWNQGSVSVPHRLALNTVPQPPGNVFVSALPSARRLLPSPPQSLDSCYRLPLAGVLPPGCRAAVFSVTALLNNGIPACNCSVLGSLESTCAELNGQCPCRPGVEGRSCDQCRRGYFGLSRTGCRECDCNPAGSVNTTCDSITGQCVCLDGFGGRDCNRCSPDHYFIPGTGCIQCNCDAVGSVSSRCDRNGQCGCKSGVRGRRCDKCRPDHFGLSASGCTPCECDLGGSVRGDMCDVVTGKCVCVEGVKGRRCEVCPSSSLGPSGSSVRPCLECFCNGYSRRCETEEGWYQALVATRFGPGTGNEVQGFRSNGNIVVNNGQLEVVPGSQSSLTISLPKPYLGDKRTAYNQLLTFNLSVSGTTPGGSCNLSVAMVGRLSRYRRVKLVAELPPLTSEPSIVELPLVPGRFQVDVWYWKTLATQTDIRQILADIRQIMLTVTFNGGATPKRVHLHSVSLGYATNVNSDPYIIFPLQNVSYIENCTCPPNRNGLRCEICSPGYTTDPSYGGEFARCVRCFCNFHSESCDPMSGVCFNCSDNTSGESCEECANGYYRNSSLNTDGCIECGCHPPGTLGGACNIDSGRCVCSEGYRGRRCDLCEQGFWSPKEGECTPCNCHPNGSSSLACSVSTGVCPCLSSVSGDRCDQCSPNTTHLFPDCESCDECTGHWKRKIDPLRSDIMTALELVASFNVSLEPDDVPLISEILDLIRQIRALLKSSQLDPELVRNVTALHVRLCELTNQTTGFVQRAELVRNETSALGERFSFLEGELSRLTSLLMQLQSELESLTKAFGNITLVDPSPYAELVQAALNRSDRAATIVAENVTTLVVFTEGVLAEYNRKLAASNFLARQMENMRRLSDISQRLSEFEAFLALATTKLCGGEGNSTGCKECGGLECPTCGGGEGCGGLLSNATDALNTSQRAMTLAQDARGRIASQVTLLEAILADALTLRNESGVAEVVAMETVTRAEAVLQEVVSLLEEVRGELGVRLDVRRIAVLEEETLALRLSVTTEEFVDILVAINATIDAFFGQLGVNVTDLRRRAVAALGRAEKAEELTRQLVTNSSRLDSLLSQLLSQQKVLKKTFTETEGRNRDTLSKVVEANTTLDEADAMLAQTRIRLNSLTQRLSSLQELVERNKADLAAARNLTQLAENNSNTAFDKSGELESDLVLLQRRTNQKLALSKEQLATTLDLRNRIRMLEQRASEQLLLVENLDRRKTVLMTEQSVIRGDIQRLAIQLEELNRQIQAHIARNTGCLDTGILQ